MSYGQVGNCAPEFGYCEALVRGIGDIAGVNNPSFNATPVGTLQMAFDPANLANAQFILQEENAVRKIRVKRLQRSTADDALEDNTCEITTTKRYNEQCITVNMISSIAFETSKNEMQAYCAAASRVVTGGADDRSLRVFNDTLDKLLSNMNGIRESVNKQIISKIAASVGVNVTPGDNLPKNLTMIDSITGAKIEKGIQELQFDMANNQVYGIPFVVGFGNFDKFNTSANWGCCNQFGMNWGMMASNAPYRYYTDVMMANLLGDPNRFFVFAPGAVQFVQYNDTVLGALTLDSRHGDTIYGTIPDPLVPGLKYDLAIQEKNCVGGRREPSWIASLYVNFDVAIQPIDIYSPSDRLYGSNGIYWFNSLAV